MSIHVGTSGWSYDHWEHVLYRPGLPAWERLDRYVQEFDTVELNASFYRWPRDSTFAGWRRRLPDGFRMSVKAPRGLTHAKRLYAPEVWADRIARSWHELGDRRDDAARPAPAGPGARRRPARLVPPVVARLGHRRRRAPAPVVAARRRVRAPGAARRCERRDERGPPAVRAACDRPDRLRPAARPRPPAASTAGPTPTTTCAGGRTGSASGRTRGHDVLVYFNNDGGGNAVRNARTLRWLLGA